MRWVHLDAVGGIAGDMFVAAMLDALPDLRGQVLADVRAVLPADASVELNDGSSGGIRVLRFAAEATGAHGLHDYPEMMGRIADAGLSEGTAHHAGAILTILGEVEARIHGVTLDEVHFHEIADWDSVADVVAAGSIIAAIGEARWTVSDLPRGSGLVRTQHGLLPVPAPATAAMLAGFSWRDDGIGGERVTPTGAAILRHLGAAAGVGGSHRLVAEGTGAGTRDLPGLPNVLRALVFEDGADPLRERVAMIGFHVDDMTGEELAEAAERIRATEGVLECWMRAAIGKKARPLTEIRVIAREDALNAVQRVCLQQTSTLGLRWRIEERIMLARAERASDAGPRVKAAVRPDGSTTVKAESDDLRPAADLAARRRLQHEAER